MKKVLFVCYGNIMRSQIAEGYYNFLTNSNNAISAGTDPTTPNRFDKPAEEVIEVMKEDGVDVSDKKVKYVTEDMINKVDEVYVLTRKQDCPDFLFNSSKVFYHYVEDPYGSSIKNFRNTRDAIKAFVKSII